MNSPRIAKPRQAPHNCQVEPAYPDHATVVLSIRYPEMCAHLKTRRCVIEEPHLIADCGEFQS